jgi:hypothetical protein
VRITLPAHPSGVIPKSRVFTSGTRDLPHAHSRPSTHYGLPPLVSKKIRRSENLGPEFLNPKSSDCMIRLTSISKRAFVLFGTRFALYGITLPSIRTGQWQNEAAQSRKRNLKKQM